MKVVLRHCGVEGLNQGRRTMKRLSVILVLCLVALLVVEVTPLSADGKEEKTTLIIRSYVTNEEGLYYPVNAQFTLFWLTPCRTEAYCMIWVPSDIEGSTGENGVTHVLVPGDISNYRVTGTYMGINDTYCVYPAISDVYGSDYWVDLLFCVPEEDLPLDPQVNWKETRGFPVAVPSISEEKNSGKYYSSVTVYYWDFEGNENERVPIPGVKVHWGWVSEKFTLSSDKYHVACPSSSSWTVEEEIHFAEIPVQTTSDSGEASMFFYRRGIVPIIESVDYEGNFYYDYPVHWKRRESPSGGHYNFYITPKGAWLLAPEYEEYIFANKKAESETPPPPTPTSLPTRAYPIPTTEIPTPQPYPLPDNE